ncbi:MAG: HAMP domain-containing histidine kinase [Candidatus Sabulitectum sp.]|nr:HAMP domain-containing histidine kinase [Candidatus Sabulitectum sp.]
MHNTFRRRMVFVLFASIVIWVFLWYSHDLVNQLNQSNKKDCETIAWLWAGVQYPFSIIGDEAGVMSCTVCGYPRERIDLSVERSLLFCPICSDSTIFIHTARLLPSEREEVIDFTRRLFGDLVTRLDFPTIFADQDNNPQIADGEVVDGFPGDRIIELRKRMDLLAEQNEPIPIIAKGDTIGHLFYGTSTLDAEMRLIPFVELGLLLLIAAVVFMFLRSEISRDKDLSWVGFARETAHQISTPLSSLMGWIELLKEDPELSGNSELDEALVHMDADVNRLNSIAQRYGQMGRRPRLKPISIEKTVSEVVDYFNARKGLLGTGVTLEIEQSADEHIINGNSVLLGWVLENLIKNAVSSCASCSEGGKVIVSCEYTHPGATEIEIRVSDQGRGIPYSDQGRIFQPGFTTRKGGWGLGLSLARRIVEEYHNGSIRLLSSTPDVGTVFSILLPLKGGDDQ